LPVGWRWLDAIEDGVGDEDRLREGSQVAWVGESLETLACRFERVDLIGEVWLGRRSSRPAAVRESDQFEHVGKRLLPSRFQTRGVSEIEFEFEFVSESVSAAIRSFPNRLQQFGERLLFRGDEAGLTRAFERLASTAKIESIQTLPERLSRSADPLTINLACVAFDA
jgi:hypothetical protein